MVVRVDVSTDRREVMVDVTSQVREALRSLGVRDGWVQVYSPHTTAAITVNEHADPDVAADILASLARLVPRQGSYRHAEGNSDAHAKATIVGESVTVPVEDGRLVLGTWQGIFFCEFDGPRSRHFLVTGIGETG